MCVYCICVCVCVCVCGGGGGGGGGAVSYQAIQILYISCFVFYPNHKTCYNQPYSQQHFTCIMLTKTSDDYLSLVVSPHKWVGNVESVSMARRHPIDTHTVYPKKYEHGFVVLCFVVVMQSFIMNSHQVFIHIHQGCFAGTGAIVRLPQCRWSKPGGYGKISQCITTTKHSKAKTVCIFLGIYCITHPYLADTQYHAWGVVIITHCQ